MTEAVVKILLWILALGFLIKADAEVISIHKNGNRKQWETYKSQFNLTFSDDESRYKIYLKNLQKIISFNAANSDLILGMNRFGHMTFEEYLNFVKGFGIPNHKKTYNPKYVESSIKSRVIDWRQKGVVTHVKDQKTCGSCWAFSAVGSLESQYAIKYSRTVLLSEQELVDCSRSYENFGCHGGTFESAFDYVKDNGIDSEKDYPYIAKDDKCRHRHLKSVLKVESYVSIESGNEDQLTKAILDHGPISIALDVSSDLFRFYKSGVLSTDNCSRVDLDHALLAVGVQIHPSPHYIIKNSWGVGWGQDGYLLLARNKDNMCGVATDAAYPSIIKRKKILS